ncbi:MAG: response regulator [Aliidongia sp.]
MSTDRLLVIVEDDDAFARTLKRSFERRDYTVVHAANFEDLTRILQAYTPGYAVVDLKLGGISGLTCVEPAARP